MCIIMFYDGWGIEDVHDVFCWSHKRTNIRSNLRSVASLVQYRCKSAGAMQVGWHISPYLHVGDYLEGHKEQDTVEDYGVVPKKRLCPRIEHCQKLLDQGTEPPILENLGRTSKKK